jgi:transposase
MTPQETPSVAETEVTEKAKRRGFTAAYRQRILDEAARCVKRGELGSLLRREGLFSSHLAGWRKSRRERSEVNGLDPQKRGPKVTPKDERDVRIVELEHALAKLQQELLRATAVIEIQKKVSELFGTQPATSGERS